jgi:hypothetical protein
MIKVNLLTQSMNQGGTSSVAGMAGGGSASEENASSSLGADVRNQAVSKMLVVFLPVFGMYVYSEFYNLPALRNSQASLSAQVSELETFNTKNQELTDEITKINQDKANIQARIKTIQKISKHRFDEVKMIEALQQMMVERVYLTSVTYKYGKVTISGYGETTKDVIDFQDQLQKSVLLRNVVLVQQRDDVLNEQTVKQFEMNFRLEENL